MKRETPPNLSMSLFIPLILFFFASSCGLKDKAVLNELLKDKTIMSSIKPGDLHKYNIKLRKGGFAVLRLEQKGTDVVIITYDPDNNRIAEFDSPNGRNGPEIITIQSGKGGYYPLEVRTLDAQEPEGKYELKVIRKGSGGKSPDRQIDLLMTAWDNPATPGAAIAVVKDGSVIFKKGYGSANLEYDIPISPSSVFHIASISKQFTTFAILLLEKEGKLSLDDDIRKYIPEVPDFGKTITLRHLAHHTSGMRDQWNLLAMAGWRLDDVITKEHILKLVSRQKELNFNPGDEFLYCNTGFTLLAEVVERVSGKPFAVFTKERIFDPLKMTNTLFYDDHEKIVSDRVYSYYTSATGYKKSVLNYANAGATSLFTTAEDLSRWAVNFENPVVGDTGIIASMNTRGILNNGDTISYALGQSVGNYKGLRYISHGGADAGYRSFLGRYPDQKFSVIVLSNEASFIPGEMATRIADIYLKDNYIIPDVKPEAPVPSVEIRTFEADQDLLKSYCGQYEAGPGLIITFSMEGERLFAEAPNLAKTEMNQISATEFSLKAENARITFMSEEDGKVIRVKLNIGGREIIAPRIKDFDRASVILDDYTGDFYSPELATSYRFIVKDGKLTATHQRLSDFILTPTKPDFFSADQWFFSYVEFVRNVHNRIIGCRVSNGRVRNLWFEKVKN